MASSNPGLSASTVDHVCLFGLGSDYDQKRLSDDDLPVVRKTKFKLVKIFHPDKTAGTGTRITKMINTAFDALEASCEKVHSDFLRRFDRQCPQVPTNSPTNVVTVATQNTHCSGHQIRPGYYELLSLDRSATMKEVQSTYKKFEAFAGGGSFETLRDMVKEAFETLRDLVSSVRVF